MCLCLGWPKIVTTNTLLWNQENSLQPSLLIANYFFFICFSLSNRLYQSRVSKIVAQLVVKILKVYLLAIEYYYIFFVYGPFPKTSCLLTHFVTTEVKGFIRILTATLTWIPRATRRHPR